MDDVFEVMRNCERVKSGMGLAETIHKSNWNAWILTGATGLEDFKLF